MVSGVYYVLLYNILLLETFKFEDKICLKHGSYNLEKVLNLV